MFECFAIYDYADACYTYLVVNLISAFYYLRIVKIMFFDRSPVKKSFNFISKKISFIFYALVLLTFCLFLNTELLIPYVDLLHKIVDAFYANVISNERACFLTTFGHKQYPYRIFVHK